MKDNKNFSEEKKFSNQLINESNQTPESVKEAKVNIGIKLSENGPFLIVPKGDKYIITIAGFVINSCEFDTVEAAEERIKEKNWEDILVASKIFSEEFNKNKKK